MSTQPRAVDTGVADEFTRDLWTWIRSQSEWRNDGRFRADLRRFLRQYVGRWTGQQLSVDQTGGARGVDYVIGDAIAVVLTDSITKGSNRWLYRELGIIGQQYEYVVVIGHDLTEEHIDVWRSLGRRMDNRSNSTFRFLTAEEVWNPTRSTVSPVRTVNSVLGVGATVITFFAIALNAVSAFGPVDPMAGAFAGSVFVLCSAVLVFCLFIVRSF